MRSWIDVRTLLCAACIAGATACSDDGEGPSNDAGRGGSGGATAGTGGSAGRGGTAGASGGTGGANGGTGGATAGTGGAAAGTGGAAAGTGGTVGGDAGADEPDAGPDTEGDAGDGDVADSGAPPDEVTVTFDDVFPILVANCGGCHGDDQNPLFAVADQDAAYAVTQGNGAGDQPIYERMIARAVELRTMPPGCNGGDFGTGTCLEEDEADELQAWVDDGAEE